MVRKQLDAALAQESRLTAERDGVATLNFPAELLERRSVPETAAAIADQERQFAERKTTLQNQTLILRTRLEQTSKELGGVRQQETAYKDQLANLSAEIENLSELQRKGLYPKSKLMALQREYSRLEGQLGSAQAEAARLGEVLQETKLQIAQAEQKFREEAGQQLTEVRARLSDARERLRVTDDIMSRIEIRAPQNGVVQGLKVHTPGAVVRPGETLAELVPSGDRLIMAVRVSPLDIDNVETGQKAEVRLPGFASRGLKTILGRVERVGADVMQDDYTKEPYYLARVEVDPRTIPAEVEKRLQPGMPADVLITTGERTILQYLVGPISDLIAKSMREQ
jgi:HlyD family secretion protein